MVTVTVKMTLMAAPIYEAWLPAAAVPSLPHTLPPPTQKPHEGATVSADEETEARRNEETFSTVSSVHEAVGPGPAHTGLHEAVGPGPTPRPSSRVHVNSGLCPAFDTPGLGPRSWGRCREPTGSCQVGMQFPVLSRKQPSVLMRSLQVLKCWQPILKK